MANISRSADDSCGAVSVAGDNQVFHLATEESRLVRWSRRLVMAVLIGAAALCVIATYRVMAAAERREFEIKVRVFSMFFFFCGTKHFLIL